MPVVATSALEKARCLPYDVDSVEICAPRSRAVQQCLRVAYRISRPLPDLANAPALRRTQYQQRIPKLSREIAESRRNDLMRTTTRTPRHETRPLRSLPLHPDAGTVRLRQSIKRAPPSMRKAELPGSGMVVTLPLIKGRVTSKQRAQCSWRRFARGRPRRHHESADSAASGARRLSIRTLVPMAVLP